MLVSVVFAIGFLLISSASVKKTTETTTHNRNSSPACFSDHYHLYSPPISESLVFAGEKVPLERYDIRESLDRELLVNAYWQSNILLYCKRAYRYFPLMESILKEEGVPEDFKYLALIESGLTNVVSPAKAAGFWQFLKETGIQHGLEVNDEIDERYHLEKSTRAACQYLKRAYEKFGSWVLAAAAYNMGENGVRRTIEEQKVSSYWDLLLNSETARYVYRILAAKLILSNPQEYGIQLHLTDLYQPLTVKNITVNTPVPDLASFANDHDMTYKQLKLLNPWLRSNKLTNKLGKNYTITLIDKKDAVYENQIQSLDVEQMLSGL
ncbi:MAG: transglycosylase SLT domain-containing protein [Bacteroidales bacterium]|nr:transglycosylase SLT domain-containing protein [Bacteroidales bacterium]